MTGRVVTVDLDNINDNGVQVFNDQYDLLLGVAMQKHTWKWTKCQRAIAVEDIDVSEDVNYTHKIAMPKHLKVLNGVWKNDNYTGALSTTQHDKYIYVRVPDDVDTIYMEYVSDPCEAIMPDYFVAWFVYFLAAEMVLEVSGDTDRLKMLSVKQAEFLKVALAADNKRGGAKIMATDRYLSVRN